MKDLLKQRRKEFLNDVIGGREAAEVDIVVLTHVLPDRPELLEALARLGRIASVIAIPYSVDEEVYRLLQTNYNIQRPSLGQLRSRRYLVDLIRAAYRQRPIVISEIGGYFADALDDLKRILGAHLLGVVEDTEQGHRAYESRTRLPCPVISIARSRLKHAEDSLVGASCLFSTERLLRDLGFLLEPRRSLVLGYGRVGCGIAHALQRRQCPTLVYDLDPVKRVVALGEGFAVPERHAALRQADIVFGATGRTSIVEMDFPHLNNGVILASCSSKDVEFDLEALRSAYSMTLVEPGICKLEREGKHLYLLADGRPVNFLDSAVIGPVLSLTHAEIIVAIAELIHAPCVLGACEATLREIDDMRKQELAKSWLEHFCDSVTGHYRQA